jgi:hypothetical protein
MPLIRLKEEREKAWRYVVILPPVDGPEDLIYVDKGEPLPVATARKVLQAIGRNKSCGEADGFGWQHNIPIPTVSLGPLPVIAGCVACSG